VDSTSKAAHAASLPLVVDTIAPWPFKGRPFLFEVVIFALFAMASCVIASYMSEPRQYLGLCVSPQPAIGRIARSASFGVVMIL
jgi:hypothetical protein